MRVGKIRPMTELEVHLPFGEVDVEAAGAARASAVRRVFEKKGDNVRRGPEHCIGLLVVCSDSCAFILPLTVDGSYALPSVRTGYCLLSASCMMPNIQFEVSVQAWVQTEVMVIPAAVYQSWRKHAAGGANYTSDLMAARFPDVMWLLDQIMNKSFDGRLAAFLLEEAGETTVLQRTHEEIARYLGSAREVVTRMLRYFQAEGAANLTWRSAYRRCGIVKAIRKGKPALAGGRIGNMRR